MAPKMNTSDRTNILNRIQVPLLIFNNNNNFIAAQFDQRI